MSPEVAARADGLVQRVLNALLQKVLRLLLEELVRQLPDLLNYLLDLLDNKTAESDPQAPTRRA